MGGTPAKVVQDMAGHSDLTTTLRYMHLAPGATDDAVAALERYRATTARGDYGETTEVNAANYRCEKRLGGEPGRNRMQELGS